MKSVVPRARHEKPQVAPAVASKKRKPAKPNLVESIKQAAAELDEPCEPFELWLVMTDGKPVVDKRPIVRFDYRWKADRFCKRQNEIYPNCRYEVRVDPNAGQLPIEPPADYALLIFEGGSFTMKEQPLVYDDASMEAAEFNMYAGQDGTLARAVAYRIDDLPRLLGEAQDPPFPQLPIGIFSQAGEFVKTVTMPDPRNGFCRHYNERSSNVAKPLAGNSGGSPVVTYSVWFADDEGELIEEYDSKLSLEMARELVQTNLDTEEYFRDSLSETRRKDFTQLQILRHEEYITAEEGGV